MNECRFMIKSPAKHAKNPKLTDGERHRRFLDAAREVDASDNPKDFDKAFDKVVSPKPSVPRSRPSEK
jgi:hypothetical protein